MSGCYVFHITGINPEPWVAPESAIGRRNGKMFVQVYQSDTVKSFKEAVKEEFAQQNGWWKTPLEGHLIVEFFLWRRLDQSEAEDGTGEQSKKAGHRDLLRMKTRDAPGTRWRSPRA